MIKFECWIAGWIDIYCGLCQVLTCGYYRPWVDFKWAAFCMKKKIRK